MACYDFKGQQLLDVCRELDVAVPEQVAVIGVDNDARLCRLCTPPLSSVIPDTHRTGYEAAQLLDRMMRGEKSAEGVLIPPLGIAERQSSDVYAIDDADIVAALRFIREHACKGISRGRRAAGRAAFAADAGASLSETGPPHAACRDHPHPHGAGLPAVARDRLSLAEIANRAGFADANYFSVAFKKQMQMHA